MPRKEYIAWFDMPTNGKLHGQSVMPGQELIRCKNCKHYTKEGHVRCWNPHGMHPTDPDDYCSRAERKEEWTG